MIFSRCFSFKYFLILFIFLGARCLAAGEQGDENAYMEVARTQLGLALENYSKGDIDASKENLEHASNWLHMSLEHTQSNIVREESKQLAKQIEKYRLELNLASEKHVIARFWHKTTSLIKREAEHLIHSYKEQSVRNRMLKHILDAKMHFITAEHDLFISHNSDEAKIELEKSLAYLAKIDSSELPDIGNIVSRLSVGINQLISLLTQSENTWKQNDMIHALLKAATSLDEAKSVATPAASMKIDAIQNSIADLRKETLQASIKGKYDAIYSEFNNAIQII